MSPAERFSSSEFWAREGKPIRLKGPAGRASGQATPQAVSVSQLGCQLRHGGLLGLQEKATRARAALRDQPFVPSVCHNLGLLPWLFLQAAPFSRSLPETQQASKSGAGVFAIPQPALVLQAHHHSPGLCPLPRAQALGVSVASQAPRRCLSPSGSGVQLCTPRLKAGTN